MKKLLAAAVLLLILLLPVSAVADEDFAGQAENLLYNADFSVYSEQADLPAGWELKAYDASGSACRAGLYEDEGLGLCLGVENDSANDARICQSVLVKSDSCYLLAGLIRTSGVSGGRGANLSIDNYDLDGTYCFSEDVTGDAGWTPIEMYVLTGPEQEELIVALRLGGYGTTAVGSAFFARVSLTECDPALAVDAVDLMTENGAAGTATELPRQELPARRLFTAMLVATLLTALILAAFYVYRVRSEYAPLMSDWAGANGKLPLTAILAAAFLLRLLLSVKFYGHPTDINCFMSWGAAMRALGPANFYTSGMFADYPPGYMYICGLLSSLCELLNLTYGSAGCAFVFKLPATIADLLSAYLVYRLARKQGVSDGFSLSLAAFIALNPALAFVSGAWGQIDSILALLLAVSFYLLQSDRRILAGAVYGLGILIKPQALMAGPILAAAYIYDIVGPAWKKRLLQTLAAVLAALAVIVVLSLPCKGEQDFFWIVEKYRSTAASYPYASIEAFNMPALLGDNWASVDTLVLGLSYRTWGTLFICLAVALSSAFYIRSARKNPGALYLSAALMISIIFTFGHYMHERYLLPVFLLLLLAYIYYRDRRILLTLSVFTCSALLNALCAMYIVDHQSARGAYYDALTALGSAMTVIGCLLLVALSFDILWRGNALSPVKEPPRKKAAGTPAFAQLSVSGDAPGRYTKKDYILLFSLIAVYGVVALTNLGDTKAPESAYRSDAAGETASISLGGERYVSSIWVNGNIGNGGSLLFAADDGTEIIFDQVYDDMFRWKQVDGGFSAESVDVTLYAGSVSINEIAFFDESGALIPAVISGPAGGMETLLDEQGTVPERPGYRNGMYLDELYHGRTAYEHLHNLEPYENSHPPLGKLIIMLGVAVFGMCPFGWRIAGALTGVAMLPVFYALSRRLLKRSENAFVATALFAFDFMHFTQTRIATIDVYAVFFILLMYYCMYRYITMDFYDEPLKKAFVWLGLGGLFFGLGAASKWTCIYAGGGLALLLFVNLFSRYRAYRQAQIDGTAAEKKRVSCFWNRLFSTLLFCCGAYIFVPLVIYFAAYTPYFIYEAGQQAEYGLSDMVKTAWKYQEFMYSYHSGLNATHPYQSSWYQWPFTATPMWYYYSGDGQTVSTLTASGNPAVWWISSVGAVALLILRLLKRVKPDKRLQLICVGVLANYLPWVLVSRCTFIYHFFATVPFILLASSYLLAAIEERYEGCGFIKWVWLGLGLLFFILLYPGISGLPISREYAEILKNLPGGGLMYGA